jgi:hypothetical protein
LTKLSKSVNESFNPSLHCRDDHLTINQSTFVQIIVPRTFFSVMRAVPHIEFDLIPETSVHQQLNQSMDQSVTQSEILNTDASNSGSNDRSVV